MGAGQLTELGRRGRRYNIDKAMNRLPFYQTLSASLERRACVLRLLTFKSVDHNKPMMLQGRRDSHFILLLSGVVTEHHRNNPEDVDIVGFDKGEKSDVEAFGTMVRTLSTGDTIGAELEDQAHDRDDAVSVNTAIDHKCSYAPKRALAQWAAGSNGRWGTSRNSNGWPACASDGR